MTSAQERTRALNDKARAPAARTAVRPFAIKRIPPHWHLDDYRWRKVTSGMSSASVFRLGHSAKTSLFLKSDAVDLCSEVAAEAQRLRWLSTVGIPCPRVVRFATHAGREWLLTTALVGRTMDRTARRDIPHAVQELARTLRSLHGIPVRACPFDNRLKKRLRAAVERLEAGFIDFKKFRSRDRALKVLHRLERAAPGREDLVITHGDACLQNLIESRGRFVGFVDCGRVGVADRYQDMALMCDSISEGFGARWVSPFLGHYGVTRPIHAKLNFYRKLDGFY